MTGKQKNIFTTIWIVALLSNGFLLILYYWPQSKTLMGDEIGYLFRVTQFVHGIDIERTPIWPAGYDYFLAGPVALANAINFPRPFFFAQLIQIILWVVCGAVFWKIASHLLLSVNARLVALALFMLNPTVMAYSHYYWPEIPHIAVFLAALWLLIARPCSLFANAAVGVLLAVAALLKLVYLPVSLLLLVLIFVVRRARNADLMPSLVAPLLFFAALTPAALQNLEAHDKLMVADSSMFNAWVGLNDAQLTDLHPNAIVGQELRAYIGTAETHNARNEVYQEKIIALVKERGFAKTAIGQLKKQYFRLFDHRSYFTKQLPGGMSQKYKFANIYLAKVLRFVNDTVWFLTLLGLGIGIVMLLQGPLSWMHLLLGIVIYNLVVFLILHVNTRYMMQILPMLCLLGAPGLIYLWNGIFNRDLGVNLGGSLAWKNVAMGVLLSGLFLVLGFRSLFAEVVSS